MPFHCSLFLLCKQLLTVVVGGAMVVVVVISLLLPLPFIHDPSPLIIVAVGGAVISPHSPFPSPPCEQLLMTVVGDAVVVVMVVVVSPSPLSSFPPPSSPSPPLTVPPPSLTFSEPQCLATTLPPHE